MLCALILDKLHIPSRLVNGAVSMGPGHTVGHTWVEFEDGAVLDAAWRSIGKKNEVHPDHPDWFRFGGSYRFANQCYPYSCLPKI